MKRSYAAKRRERLRRMQEWRRNGLFALISLIAHAVLVLLLPAMAAPAPIKTVLMVELAAKPKPMVKQIKPTPVEPAADTMQAPPAASETPAQTTPKPEPVKQSAPANAKPAQTPQAPKAEAAKPSPKPAPAQSAPSTPTSDVKLTPAQPAQPVAPKSEEKTPVESKPAEQQAKPNPQPEPKAEPKPEAQPSSGSEPEEKPASAPPVNMPKDGPPAAPPAKEPGAGTEPANPSGPEGPETAAPSPPPGPSKEELGLLSSYGDAARKRIKSQARNPDAGGGGTVKFEFTVAQNGRLVDVKLVESSGYKLLDNDALEAAQVSFNESHEIIPFPKGVKVEQWTFFMALKYPLW